MFFLSALYVLLDARGGVVLLMSSTDHDEVLRAAQRALAVMILGTAVLGSVAVLSAPLAIGLYDLRGLWITAALLVPLALQGWGLMLLRRVKPTLSR